MLMGALALVIGIFHYTLGPVSAPTVSLERAVAEHVSAIKKGVIAGLKGQNPSEAEGTHRVNIDKVIDNTGIGLAVLALVFAFVGGMCKENSWSIRGAIVFGGGTLAFHAILFGIAVVFAILVLMLILSWLSGTLPV